MATPWEETASGDWEEPGPSPLELYIAYDYLPAHQQAMFLFAVSGVYDAVMSTHEPDVDSVREYRLLRYLFRRYAVQRPPGWAYPPLSVDGVVTGESVRWKFAPARRKWPGWKFSKKGDLEIIVPRWTAAAVVAGMVLIGGAGPVSTVLSVQEKFPADTAIHSVEERAYIQKKLDEELARLNLSKEHLREFKVNRLANTNDPAGRAVQLHRQNFLAEANQPNIRNVEINGAPIDRRDSGRRGDRL